MTARGFDINFAIRRGAVDDSATSTDIQLHHKVDAQEFILSHLGQLTVGDVKSRFGFEDFEFLDSAHALSIQVRGRPVDREKITREWDNHTIQAIVTHYTEALLQRQGLHGFAHTIKVELIVDYDQPSPWGWGY